MKRKEQQKAAAEATNKNLTKANNKLHSSLRKSRSAHGAAMKSNKDLQRVLKRVMRDSNLKSSHVRRLKNTLKKAKDDYRYAKRQHARRHARTARTSSRRCASLPLTLCARPSRSCCFVRRGLARTSLSLSTLLSPVLPVIAVVNTRHLRQFDVLALFTYLSMTAVPGPCWARCGV